MIILRTVKNFSSLNIAASILLFLMAILAAVIANSPMAPLYQGFLLQELHLRIGDFNLFSHGGHPLKMIEFINDCLMTVFFLAVGLEIKRELLVGELSSFRKASLPFVAACGGMLVPVIVYSLLVVQGTPETRGMAIPMATDIAFSLGVLSLLGKRVPLSLKIFLTAFAVVDDIGGILVIAIFYSSEVAYGYLIVAAVLYFFLYYMGKFGMTQKIFFLLIGVIIWYLFLQSGIHSTISGVILCHSFCFGPRLVASLSSGNNADRVRVFIQIFHSLIQTIFKNWTRTILSHLCAKYDNIVEPPSSIRVHLADHTALYDTKHKQSDTDNHSCKDFYRMRHLFPHFHVHGNSKQKHHDPDTNPYKEKSCAGTGRMNHYRINHTQDSKQ